MNRTTLTLVAIAVLLLGGVGLYVAYDQVLRGDSTPALTLPPASAEAETPTEAPASDPATSDDPASGTPATAAPADGDLNGTWTVTDGSQAGYRVREQLAQLPAESDAVGRTSDVSGSIEVTSDGTTATVTSGTIEVDTTTIQSDENMRDNRLRREGLETDTYPTATFTITQPVEVPAEAVAGTATEVTLVGDLTLHGVTKSVQIPAQARYADGTIQVAGSITFPLSDFGITAPNIGGFIVSIADEGTLEFVTVFAKG